MGVWDPLVGGPAVIAAVRSSDLNALGAAEIVAGTRIVAALIREAQALQLALAAAGSKKDAHKAAGASSMSTLIETDAGLSRVEANRAIKLASQLDRSPVLSGQLSRPGMSPTKARIVADAVDLLPPDLSAADRELVEKDLAEAAPGMSVDQLRRKTRRAIEVVDRDRADRIENNRLKREEANAVANASFWMSPPDDRGMVTGGFKIDALSADILRSALDALTSPRRNTDHNDTAELPAFTERQGTAFTHLLRHLPTDQFGNHGGVTATLMITITEDSLRQHTNTAGVTEHGTPISAGQLRQLACNAGIIPAVLGSTSQVLDLGREQRLHNQAQRRALAHRDHGCAFPGCSRPPRWCETHHIQPWTTGGPTTLNNGVLLRGYHHRQVHNNGWTIKLNPRDQLPDFYPPGSTLPQRNTRYQPLQATA